MSMLSRHSGTGRRHRQAEVLGNQLVPVFKDSLEPVMVSGMAPLAIRMMLDRLAHLLAKRLC